MASNSLEYQELCVEIATQALDISVTKEKHTHLFS
jgi:hypothetical protein